MQKYTKYVKICKNHPRHLHKFLLTTPAPQPPHSPRKTLRHTLAQHGLGMAPQLLAPAPRRGGTIGECLILCSQLFVKAASILHSEAGVE